MGGKGRKGGRGRKGRNGGREGRRGRMWKEGKGKVASWLLEGWTPLPIEACTTTLEKQLINAWWAGGFA